MKIQALPSKETLTHFNVQYYHNDAGQGSATHVVQVRYSTNPDPIKARQQHHQRVVTFNLKTENKAINRLVKDHLGEDAKEDVKAKIKALKKELGIITSFGFRRVQYALPHKFVKGAVFHKNTIDPNTSLYWLQLPDNTNILRFEWAGQVIEVPMVQQINPKANQSLMYAYWSSSIKKEELKEYLKEKKNAKDQHGRGKSEVAADSADVSVTEAEHSGTDHQACEVDAVAGVKGDSEAGSVGNDNPTQSVKRKSKRAGKPVQHPGDFSDYGNLGFENGFGFLDQASESPFFDKHVERDTNLGTSIRF